MAIPPGRRDLNSSAHIVATMRLAQSELMTVMTVSSPPSLAIASGPWGCSARAMSWRRTSGLCEGLAW
eukprot:scaffold334705_cov37-Prasinocladus_malaysianus.AAC.1